MGKSSSQTIGYWYRWAIHFGWCRGPLDAVIQVYAGGKSCWVGRQTTSGTISINQPQLWGGASGLGGQGGLDGDMDILMGEPTQAPSAYLTATFGAEQSGHRGKLTTVWKGGRYGAFSATPQPMSLKVERILADWEGGSAWYPEKARIRLDGAATDAIAVADTQLSGLDAHTAVDNGTVIALSDLDPTDQVLITKPPGLLYSAWSHYDSDSNPLAAPNPWANDFSATDADGNTNTYWTSRYSTADAAAAAVANETIVLTGSTSYSLWLYDTPASDNRGGFSAQIVIRRSLMWTMNPAHMIYEALTRSDMSGEPVALINDASFRAAADTLFDEGFGLCTEYDSDQETPQDFIQRIANAAGLNVSQSRVDGLYYIDLIRPVTDASGLPVLTEGMDVSFEQEPALPTENTNAVSVEYLDVGLKDTITTSPVYSMGAVRAAGQVIAETRTYHEIPSQALALRVARRDCDAASVPLSKFTLKTLRRFRGLRPGMHVRLQMASEGIADTVLLIGGVDHGTEKDGTITITAVQDVFSFADSAYVAPTTGLWTPPATDPAIITQQAALEAPYIYLASRLSNADLAALADDAGYLAAAAARPASGLNFTLDTAVLPAAYADRAQGDWCATASVPAQALYTDTALVLADIASPDRIAVGDWALWDTEIVQIQAFDADAGTLTVGRGCADTLPVLHAANSRLFFCGQYLAADPTEYADSDSVSAKLLTNLGSARLLLARAAALEVSMASRAARPYPPAGLTLNGTAYADSIEGQLVLAWARRNRVTQQNLLLDQTGADVAPESGQTETLRIYDETDTLTRTVAGSTGTGYTYTSADEAADRGGGGGTDPYYASVVSLLHFDGADGSTTFTDECGNIWTRTGSPTISTAQSVFGGASLALSGSGQYLSTPDNSNFSFQGADFTVECWIFAVSTSGTRIIISKRSPGPPNNEWAFYIMGGKLAFAAWNSGGTVVDLVGTITLPASAWTHVAVTRIGGTFALFVAGVLDRTIAYSGVIGRVTSAAQIGNDPSTSGRNFAGNIDEMRITTGFGRYSATFTPPAAPFSILPPSALNSRLRIELESARAGLASREKYNWIVLRILPSASLPQPSAVMDAATKLLAWGFGQPGNGDVNTLYVWKLDLAAGTLTRLDTARAGFGGTAYFAGQQLVNMTSAEWRSAGYGMTNFSHIDLTGILANITMPTVFYVLGTKACVFSWQSDGTIQLAWSTDGITWTNPAGAETDSTLSVTTTSESLLAMMIYPAISGWHATLILGTGENVTRLAIKSSSDLTTWTTVSDTAITDGYLPASIWSQPPIILGSKYYRWKFLDDAGAVAGGEGFGTKLVHQQFQLLSSTDDVTYTAISATFPIGSVPYGQAAPRVVGSAIQVPGHRALYSYDGATITTTAHRLAVGVGYWNSAWLALCGPAAAATTDFSTFTSKIPAATGWIAPFNFDGSIQTGKATLGDAGFTVSGTGPATVYNGAAVSSDDTATYYAEVKIKSLIAGAVSGQPRLAVSLGSETWDVALGYTSDGALTYSAPHTDAANQKSLTGPALSIGDVLGVTLDTAAKICTFSVNGVAQTALAYNTPTHQPCRFLLMLTLNAAYAHANVGQEDFAYPPATGVKAWGVLS